MRRLVTAGRLALASGAIAVLAWSWIRLQNPVPSASALFLSGAGKPEMTAAQQQMMSRMAGESAMMRMSMMQIDPAILTSIAARASLLVRFSATESVAVQKRAFESTATGFIWRGTVAGTKDPVLLIGNGTTISGTIRRAERVYVIRPMGADLHAVLEESTAAMPAHHMTMPPGQSLDAPMGRPSRPAANGSPVPARASPEKAPPPIVIRLLFAYTPHAASHYADITRDAIHLAVEETNEVFRRSLLGHIRFTLAHSYLTDYVESGTHLDHLIRFAEPGDGVMDEMHALRDQHRAAIAVLLVDDPSSCGLSAAIGAEEYQAYTVLHHACAAANLSLAHEIGHLFGARHDPAIDATSTPPAYAHGFVNGNKWRTIMSYGSACGGCPRMPLFSNPSVVIDGEPAGKTDVYDNAKVVRDAAPRIAHFR